jgi:uncharacterized protein YjiK
MGPAIVNSSASDSSAIDTNSPSPRQKGHGTATTNRKQRSGGVSRSILSLAIFFLTATVAFGQTTFGPIAVGNTSPPQSVTVTAQTAGTVAAVQVLTKGKPNLDYTAGAGTCASATLAANQQCTQTVNFSPAFPGDRPGALVLLDSSNNVLGTTYLSGTGWGGLPVLLPGNEVLYAGNGAFDLVDDGQLATLAELSLPSSVALDGAGNLYIADSAHDRIRKVDATTHIISTVAGNGDSGYLGDGALAIHAALNAPSGVAVDGAGNLYIADTKNNAVRVVSSVTGLISTVAGTGTVGYTGDGGLATAATLNQPWGVTVDAAGNLYIADTSNHVIRKVTISTGTITTVAGNGPATPTGLGGYSGDGGLAASAALNFPHAVTFDAAGNMLIPDSANNRVRKVDTTGKISTLAGTGATGYSGDLGPALKAQLWSPEGIAVDPAGNIYIADSQNNAIRKISAATGNINTMIQTAFGESVTNQQFVGNELSRPIGLALDGYGNLYVADYYFLRVRQIQPNVLGVDFQQTPVRQGTVSAPKKQTLENDGNAELSLVSLTSDANSALDTASTSCAPGTSLALDESCTLGVEFAPSVAGDPLAANITITNQSVDSALNVVLVGNAPKVNDTSVVLKATPSPSNFGQGVALTATVTTGANTGALTGTVTFFDGTTKLQSNVSVNSSGVASFNVLGLTVGTHSLTASYSGDTLHFASTALAPTLQVVNEATATTVASSASPAALGSNVTFTAKVSIANGGGVTPDGTVTFMDGSTALTTVPLTAAGTATYTTSTLSDGAHSISAIFSGDPTNYILGSSSRTVPEDVLAASTVLVASNTNPSNYGTPVTFTATVTSPASVAPTGVVNLLDGSTQIGSTTLAGNTGIALFTTSSLSAGTHAITAAYNGSPNSGPGTSTPIVQTINRTQTTTGIAASPIPGIAGAPVTLTASVAVIAGSATVTGNIAFNDGAVKLGTATLGANGKATINPLLAPGAHAIVASYGGDTNDNASTSTPLAVNMILATTSVALKTSGSPAYVLSGITFSAAVTGNGGTPTGTVMFAVDGKNVSSVTVGGSGSANFTDSSILVGNHTVVATYSGDTNDNPSSSGGVTEVVQAIPTVTDLGLSSSPGPNTEAILVATALGATGPTPTGAITFTYGDASKVLGSATLDSSGVATVVPDLPPGKYSVVASYSGDSLHTPSTSSAVSFAGTPIEFGVAVNPAALTLVSSQNGTVTVNVTSSNGFADSIGMGCLSLPAAVNCHFSINTVALKAGQSQAVQLTIDTNAPLSGGQTASRSSTTGSGLSLAALGLPGSLLFGFVFWRFRKRNAAALVAVLALFLAGAMAVTGCGGSFSQHTVAPGTYTIQVGGIGTASNISHYQNVTLTITK